LKPKWHNSEFSADMAPQLTDLALNDLGLTEALTDLGLTEALTDLGLTELLIWVSQSY